MSHECMFSEVPTLGRVFMGKSSWSKGPPSCIEIVLSLSDRNRFSVCSVMTCNLLSVCFHVYVGTRVVSVTLTGWGCLSDPQEHWGCGWVGATLISHSMSRFSTQKWVTLEWSRIWSCWQWDRNRSGVFWSEVRWREAVQFWGPCFLQVQAILVCLRTLSSHIKSSSLGG